MKDELEILERLAIRAREYVPEPITVADNVVWQLHQPERTPLLWMSVSAVIAAVIIIFTVGFTSSEADSLDMLFQTAYFIQTEEEF